MVASIMLMDDPKEFVKRKDMTKYRFEDYDEGYRKQVPRGALSTFVKAHSDMQLSIGTGTPPHHERPHRREEIPESYHHWLEYVWVWVWCMWVSVPHTHRLLAHNPCHVCRYVVVVVVVVVVVTHDGTQPWPM